MGERGPKPRHTGISCPNTECTLYGMTGKGNVTSHGTYLTKSGDEIRKFICRRCGRVFNSRTGTAYEGIHCSQRDFDVAVKALNEGVGVRAAGRITDHTKDTIQKWSIRSGRQCAAVSGVLENNVDPSYMEFDEMTTVLKKNRRK